MPQRNVTPDEALERLRHGNKRFVSGHQALEALVNPDRRQDLAQNGQRPFATVLSCSDSRVPSELIFDAALGDLFIVRVAGNIIAPSLIGSIEFATQNFDTPLCLVMGHTGCGAIAATLNCIETDTRPASDNIRDIVVDIFPAVRETLENAPELERQETLLRSTRRNVELSMQRLLHRSKLLRDAIDAGVFKVAGAVYDIHTGKVEFLENPSL